MIVKYEQITTVELINMCLTSHSCCVCVCGGGGTLVTCSLGRLQVWDTLLLTSVTSCRSGHAIPILCLVPAIHFRGCAFSLL